VQQRRTLLLADALSWQTATKHAFGVETEKISQLLEPSAMKTILALVATTGLLIGSAAIGNDQQNRPRTRFARYPASGGYRISL
jgi:hypothetical protein